MAKILLLDTSSNHCTVVLDNDGQLSSLIETQARAHAQKVLSQVQRICLEAELTLKDLDAVAVVAGPGSFTGLRIGVGVVQGIAEASSKPVIIVSNLAALAQTACERHRLPGQLVATMARDGEIYFAVYTADANGIVMLQAAEQVALPDALHIPRLGLPPDQWVGVGDGWEYRDALITTLGITPKIIDPGSDLEPAAICRLAQSMYANGELVSAEQALPHYIKENMHYRQAH
ncbi:MAG: tRNA (adenosine(37)-N6)-threonylcarbamoyltransferase complex dimerization subunit type 1 TsaB [Pseudohongiellaceae bacterium]